MAKTAKTTTKTSRPLFEIKRTTVVRRVKQWQIRKTKTRFYGRVAGWSVKIFNLPYPKSFFLSFGNRHLFGYADATVLKSLKTASTETAIHKQRRRWLKQEKEFLVGLIKNNRLTLWRDSHCTLPLYFAASPKRLLVCDSFLRLAKSLPKLKLDRSRVLEHLAISYSYHDRTIFKEIRALQERSILIFGGGTAQLIKPPSTRLIKLGPSRTPEKIAAKLQTALKNRLKDLPTELKLGVELSCGVDSSLVTALLSKLRKGRQIDTFTVIFPNDYGRSQTEKLTKLRAVLPIRTHTVPAEKHPPIINDQLDYYQQEIYQAVIDRLAKKARRKGVDCLLTGIGGDELCLPDRDEDNNFKNRHLEELKTETSNFFLPILKNQKFAFISYPRPPLSHSVYGANDATNAIFIQNNIWPIAPLSSVKLTRLIRSLPKSDRCRKEIFRLVLESFGLSPEIARPAVNENYGSIFDEYFRRRARKKIEAVFKHSQLEKLDLLPPQTLLGAYRRLLEGDQTIPAFRLYAAYTLEQIIKPLAEKLVINISS